MLFKSLNRFLFSTLMVAEHNNKFLLKGVSKLLSASAKLKQQTHLLIVGNQLTDVVNHAKSIIPSNIVSKIITADSPSLAHNLTENYESIINQLIQQNKYENVIALTSSLGKDVIPRIAAGYNCQPLSDITDDNQTFIRPTYAGNALSKFRSKDKIKFLTFRSSSFQELVGVGSTIPVESFDISKLPSSIKTEFLHEELSNSNKPELTTARIVVSGGRGVKSKENFALIENLANAFGDAAIGASRAAVDAGYCPNQLQVGQTGKVVAPQLYIAVGISGAVQHLAGMKDSKVIVAINNRPEQAIFEVATYGLVGDLFKVVPELTEKLKKLK